MPEIRGSCPGKERMNNETTAGGATPCISLLGLSVHHKEDGCWMRFKASNGREAYINLNAYADDHGSIIGSAIRQWIEDVKPNDTLHGSPLVFLAVRTVREDL